MVAGAWEGIASTEIVQAAHHVGLGFWRSEDVDRAKQADAHSLTIGIHPALIHFLGRDHAALRNARDNSRPAAERPGTKVGPVIHRVHAVVGVAVGFTESDVVSAIDRI